MHCGILSLKTQCQHSAINEEKETMAWAQVWPFENWTNITHARDTHTAESVARRKRQPSIATRRSQKQIWSRTRAAQVGDTDGDSGGSGDGDGDSGGNDDGDGDSGGSGGSSDGDGNW